VKASHSASELDRMKKSVKAAFMLIPLLGIPNIMQTIPFSPTHENITYFAIWTYCASFTYMYQGLIISIIYCFTNREVQAVIKSCYNRYKLQHKTSIDLRRTSRTLAMSQFTAVHNGVDKNGNNRKDSDSSPSMKLLLPSTVVSSCSCTSRRNLSTESDVPVSFCSCTEQTPLRSANTREVGNGSGTPMKESVVRIHEYT
jgi:hypothetical protein